ncbi:putative fungal specific transcription factor domain-containing protein, partial [Colletotrichum sublineola]
RPSTCRYSPQQRRRTPAPTPRTPSPSVHVHNGLDHQAESRQSGSTNDPLAEEETEVPREARLLCDAQGKLIFIGDCAPLSFFQTVRQLVNTRVDPQVFAHQSENPPFRPPTHYSGNDEPDLHLATIPEALSTYHAVTSGLVDLFDHAHFVDEVGSWAQQTQRLQDASSATFYLVLAIGYQSSNEGRASSYFDYARNIALANLSGNINVPTIRTFILVTLYMLGSCQMNGAFLFFAVILVSRPFLMYELHKRLAGSSAGNPISKTELVSGKSKLADACIDAASFMVDMLVGLAERGYLNGHMPLIVSWLFASSLILGVGLLGSFGRILEKYTRNSIMVLEHFAKSDAHASQYSLIAKALLNVALDYLEKKELQERTRRTESSSQLFGLVPRDNTEADQGAHPAINDHVTPANGDGRLSGKSNGLFSGFLGLGSPSFPELDASFVGLSSSLPRTPDLSALDGRNDADHSFSDLNLFQLLDADGHIDLGPYI